jgi:hypothetical protein
MNICCLIRVANSAAENKKDKKGIRRDKSNKERES